MRNMKTSGCFLFIALLLSVSPMLFAEAAETAEDGPFHTQVKGYDVRSIHAAADHIMFKTLSLSKIQKDDSAETASRVDALTGRIEAASADKITFIFSVYYVDENTCGVRIYAFQKPGVADLKKFCQLIYDKTIQRLEQKKAQEKAPENVNAEAMEFSGEYDLTVDAMYKVMNETANYAGLGHSTRIRNRFTIEGAFTSGETQFSYKAYLVEDNKLKFRFWRNSPSETADGDRYIYETIRKEFQRQLKLAR